MKFVIVTKENDSLPLADRLMKEDHEVRVYQEKHQAVWTGLVDKISLEDIPEFKPDLVINLETSLPRVNEELTTQGLTVLGGFKIHHQLEEKRYESLMLAEKNGILIPSTMPFDDPQKAIQALKESSQRMCVKVNNDEGEKHMSFLGKSNDDVIHFIETKYEEKHEGLIVQEFIEGPAELNVEGWFSQGNLVWPMNAGMEQKRLMPGDMGPNTGCQATITWPLSNTAMVPWTSGLLSYLKEQKYTGPLDMAFKLGKDNKFYFLEFTPRLGINAGFGIIDLLDEDLGKFLYSLATGRATEMHMKPLYDYLITISVPPYPYEIPKIQLPGVEISYTESKNTHLWLWNVETRKGKLVTSSGYPVVGHASGWGETAVKAANRAVALADEVEVSSKQYRNDVEHLIEGAKRFHSMGVKI